MSGFIQGIDRHQETLFPESLDDYIDHDNPTRVIDVFIDSLKLIDLGFTTIPSHTGRPGYHPSILLKLYLYGYLNRIQSSRRLECETQRNVELMWLLGRLTPDFKTIADFRKDNGKAIKRVCSEFVLLSKRLGLLATECVAVDGSKFKAVNNADRAFSKAKIERRRQKIDESIDDYLKEIERVDRQNTKESRNKIKNLKQRLAKVEKEAQRLELLEKELLETPDKQISMTDPDARIMATRGRSSVMVGYNVQIAVDTKNHLIIAHEVTNIGNDRSQLSNIAIQANEVLGCDDLCVLADKGYYKGEEILACNEAGLTTYLPRSKTSNNRAAGLYDRSEFIYNAEKDEYVCPANQVLSRRHSSVEQGKKMNTYYASNPVCRACPKKEQCTTGVNRRVRRWEHEQVLDDLDSRMANEPSRMQTRRSTVEHPFGTIKHWMGHTHFQMRTIARVSTEMSLHILSYNLKRVISIMGIKQLMLAISNDSYA
jgi:transposase